MGRRNLVLSGQIRDRPADLQNPVVGAGAKTEPSDRSLKELLGLGADLAEFLDLPRPHLGIGINSLPLEPLELPRLSTADAFSDLLRALAFPTRDNIPELNLGHLDLDIDEVKKRTGNFGVIPASLRIGTIDLKTGQADLSGARDDASANKAGVRDGVMWGAKGPRANGALVPEKAQGAVDLRHLDDLIEGHRRKDRGQSLGQHGFAGAGRRKRALLGGGGVNQLEINLLKNLLLYTFSEHCLWPRQRDRERISPASIPRSEALEKMSQCLTLEID
jgi:hypothetical protein